MMHRGDAPSSDSWSNRPRKSRAVPIPPLAARSDRSPEGAAR